MAKLTNEPLLEHVYQKYTEFLAADTKRKAYKSKAGNCAAMPKLLVSMLSQYIEEDSKIRKNFNMIGDNGFTDLYISSGRKHISM